ncbi:MAG: hypothetical protein A2902_00055 [Elusimicrobia bacterium RIFCSPLOWO2_01_FULL_64_13]|nr:MAG: hypothetical protein A2636_00580 [Elusimicrobia bacterium RIFCSPHIGHO2_01_FULL_64_10]OGR97975.1 MAG: hypothetical protein A2902_00055 [Elusimicrobia bacterium RIFCSPLOWO2_01_FULL_64_13]
MRTAVLLAGFAGFLACLTAHILVWRRRRPKNDILSLFMIFMIAPSVLLGLYGLAGAAGWAAPGLFSFPEVGALYLLHLALSSAYIQTYPCAQAESPSLKMMLIVSRHMPQGVSESELARLFDDSKLVHSRFHDLLHTGLMVEKDGRYSLSPVAERIIRFFVVYRRILGLRFKGG